MITLNQAVGTNNQTIWALRLRGEGTNLVTLGDFSASTGWTLTGDWAIGSGVATYTYVDDATGVLYRTLSAATAISYILEYEVTAVSAAWSTGATELEVNGGGSYFFASTFSLDTTLGKHSIQLLGNAGGTELRFTVSDAGATDSISIDNVSIRVADNVLYLSTRDLTLTNVYDGQVLNQGNYLTDLNQNSSIASSGGTGSVSGFSLSISRYVNNAGFSSFFNNFYPTTNAGHLTSKIIDLGVCWVGASADTDISWLFRGRIIDYNYGQRQLNLTIFQESEISNKEVPYYSVQKDFDNDMSYFSNAPEDSYGLTIPIVYGSFLGLYSESTTEIGRYKLAPCVPINKLRFGFMVASHPCFDTSDSVLSVYNKVVLFKYINSGDTYLEVFNSNEGVNSTSYNIVKYLFELSTNRGGYLQGSLFIKLSEQSQMTDVTDDANAIDYDDSTYSDLDAVGGGDNRLALKAIGEISTSEVGILGTDDADIKVSFRVATDGGGNRAYTMNYYNNTLASPLGDTTPSTGTLTSSTPSTQSHSFGADYNGKKDALPWTIEEVTGLDFYIENDQTTPGQKIRVYSAWITLFDIKVYGLNYARSIRNSGNGRGV